MRPGGERETDPVGREYARLAARYDWRWSAYVDATVEATLRHLSPAPGERILDVGCGTGALLEALSRTCPQAELAGADLTSEMLRVAAAKLGPRAVLRQARAEALPFADEAFDLVTSTSVLHYLRRPEAGLAEMRRVLRPGGRLVVTDWCDDYLACRICDRILRLTSPAHHRTFGRAAFERMLAATQFAEVAVDSYRISWLWGLMTARSARPE